MYEVTSPSSSQPAAYTTLDSPLEVPGDHREIVVEVVGQIDGGDGADGLPAEVECHEDDWHVGASADVAEAGLPALQFLACSLWSDAEDQRVALLKRPDSFTDEAVRSISIHRDTAESTKNPPQRRLKCLLLGIKVNINVQP